MEPENMHAATAESAEIHAPRSTAEAIEHVRRVLRISTTDLARTFGVARQDLHGWSRGNTMAPEKADQLRDLVGAASVLADAASAGAMRIGRRAIRDGKSFVDLVSEGTPAAEAARCLCAIFDIEERERSEVQAILARRRCARPLADDDGPGIPHFADGDDDLLP